MKTIRMLSDQVGGDGEALPAGSEQTLNDASADHWLKRKKAELVPDEGDGDAGEGTPSHGLTVPQIKEALAAANIAIPDGVTKKSDLAALLDAGPATA